MYHDGAALNVADHDSLTSLRREWGIVAGVWLVAWLASYLLLRQVWPLSLRWLVISGAFLIFGLWILRRHLPQNRPAENAALLPTLGPGNHLTLFRGLCVGLIAGFIASPWPAGALGWVIALTYTAADIADYFDGYLARRRGHVTRLGGLLDIEYDALGVLVVTLLAISFGQLPWWYIALGMARYLFLFGIRWREKAGLTVHDLSPSVHRRIIAGLQMAFMSVVLWPIVPPEGAYLVGALFFAASAASFIRDWMVVSGAIDPSSPAYRRLQTTAVRWLTIWLPPLWRAAAVAAMIFVLRQAAPLLQPLAWRDLLVSWSMPAPGLFTVVLALLAITGTAAVAVGLAGRLASILLYLPVGFDIVTLGLLWNNGMAAVAITLVLLFGTGPYSLWRPEDRIFQRPLGSEDA